MRAVLLVALGGALGAPARYLTDLLVQSRHDSVFPWGTLAVNTTGSFVAGGTAAAVSALGGPAWLLTLVVTGFCGALTTFSTFGYETVRLVEDGSWLPAVANAAAHVVLGLATCAGGWAAVSAAAG